MACEFLAHNLVHNIVILVSDICTFYSLEVSSLQGPENFAKNIYQTGSNSKNRNHCGLPPQIPRSRVPHYHLLSFTSGRGGSSSPSSIIIIDTYFSDSDTDMGNGDWGLGILMLDIIFILLF